MVTSEYAITDRLPVELALHVFPRLSAKLPPQFRVPEEYVYLVRKVCTTFRTCVQARVEVVYGGLHPSHERRNHRRSTGHGF